MIRGTHHLTFCVGGAQEDYDFHVRLLGLRSVKKTVLFDGEIPIYHLYYANRIGDLSTILTSFPYRQAGWMGRRGTNQLRTINVAVPADSLGYWADRLRDAGIEVEEAERLGTQRLDFAHPCGIPYSIVGETERDDRKPWDGGDVPLEHAIRGAYGTTTSVREPEPMDDFLRRAFGRRARRLRGPAPPVPDRHRRRRRAPDRARRGARPPAGLVVVRRGHDPPPRLRRRHARGAGRGQGLDRRPRLHGRLRRQGPRLLPLRLPAHAGRRAVRARLQHGAGLPHRRARGGARHAHVHPAALGGPARRDRPARADRHAREGRLNPHLAAPPVMVGRALARARRVAVLVHGRAQDPAYMLEHLVAADRRSRRRLRPARRPRAARGTRAASTSRARQRAVARRTRWRPWRRAIAACSRPACRRSGSCSPASRRAAASWRTCSRGLRGPTRARRC